MVFLFKCWGSINRSNPIGVKKSFLSVYKKVPISMKIIADFKLILIQDHEDHQAQEEV